MGLIAFVSAYVVLFSNGAAAQGVYPSGSTGVDVSYPNCRTSIPKTAFGIVGVTGGLFYSYNSCLPAEASRFSNLSLYTNTGWYVQSTHINPASPKACDSSDQTCLAYNYGYNAAADAVSHAQASGVSSSTWWLDVETSNSWSGDTSQNRSSLQGSYDALRISTASTVGVYSTTAQWQTVTGGWANGWPNWGATTVSTAKQAAKYCSGHAFTGGPTYLIQYSGRSLDQDYAC